LTTRRRRFDTSINRKPPEKSASTPWEKGGLIPTLRHRHYRDMRSHFPLSAGTTTGDDGLKKQFGCTLTNHDRQNGISTRGYASGMAAK
jgi:hypothetical protein